MSKFRIIWSMDWTRESFLLLIHSFSIHLFFRLASTVKEKLLQGNFRGPVTWARQKEEMKVLQCNLLRLYAYCFLPKPFIQQTFAPKVLRVLGPGRRKKDEQSQSKYTFWAWQRPDLVSTNTLTTVSTGGTSQTQVLTSTGFPDVHYYSLPALLQ